MPRFLGLVNLHNSPQIHGLTESRPLASASFLGRFAFVDFPLSNFSNSKIDNIGILVKEKPRSLIKHIGSGKMWNTNTKIGSLSLMYNEKYARDLQYNHDINNIIENKWVIDQSEADYILIAPCHLIYRLDFSNVLEQHISRNASVTMIYKKIIEECDEFIDCDALELGENNKVVSIKKNFGSVKEANISLETYVISRDVLEKMLVESKDSSKFFSIRDMLAHMIDKIDIDTYEFDGYVRNFNSLEHYYRYSLEFLKNENIELMDEDWPIFTRTYDTPPVYYGKNASVRNSLIANGSIIEGKVESSVISRMVHIEEGAIVRNSIIFSEATITKDTVVENCIVDKKATIKFVKILEGDSKNPLYIEEGDIV